MKWPHDHFEQITRLRVHNPDHILTLASRRKRRQSLTIDGKLNIIAADHPARRVTQAGKDPLAMANRLDYLTRIAHILIAGAADGVMATMDILEELLILDDAVRANGDVSFLNEKVLIASLNRGGLSKTAWELDDPITGATPQTCSQWNLDGAKMLLRIEDSDPNSLKTIKYCCEAINQLLDLNLPMFLEPLPMVRSGNSLHVNKDANALISIVGVASALGRSSSRLWLKLPYCDRFNLVAQSTTLPILLLGGDTQDTALFLKQMQDGLASASNVRGTMVGRNVLFGSDTKSPVSIAQAVHDLVHKIPVNQMLR